MNETAVFIWLVALTCSAVVQSIATVYVVLRWMPVRDRLAALDYSEQLQRVLDTLTADMLRQNNDLRRRMAKLLDQLDADPMAQDKHFAAIQSLRHLLNP